MPRQTSASRNVLITLTLAGALSANAAARQQPAPSTPAQQQSAASGDAAASINKWEDDFGGEALDPAKWEKYSIEGGAGKITVRDGQLQQRGTNDSRAGVRSKNSFTSERFYVEAALGKVGVRYPEPGSGGPPPGNAIVAVLFGGRNDRIEWLMTSDGRLEAWLMRNDKSERLDGGNLGTREKTLRLGVARRGDEFYFMINGQAGLQKNIKSMPTTFTVMLYGYGSSENNWDSVAVQTLKQ